MGWGWLQEDWADETLDSDQLGSLRAARATLPAEMAHAPNGNVHVPFPVSAAQACLEIFRGVITRLEIHDRAATITNRGVAS
jgi:hypothetical protein